MNRWNDFNIAYQGKLYEITLGEDGKVLHIYNKDSGYVLPSDATFSAVIEAADPPRLQRACASILDSLSPAWRAWIESRESMGEGAAFLDWDGETHCGIECLRVARLADFVCVEWPDVEAQVRDTAFDQMTIICNG